VAGCERDNLSAPGVKERIGGNEERLDSLLRGLDERRPEIAPRKLVQKLRRPLLTP
jgi:hypothetical protein